MGCARHEPRNISASELHPGTSPPQAMPNAEVMPTITTHESPGDVAWCVGGRRVAPTADTPRGLFPNALMSAGTKTGEESRAGVRMAPAARS